MERDGVDTPSQDSVGRRRRQHSLLWRAVRAWSRWSGRPLWYRFVGAGRSVVAIALAAEALGILLAIGGNADAALVLSCAIGIAVVGGFYAACGLVLGQRLGRPRHVAMARHGRTRRRR